jgi:N-methylhydantoinase B
VVLDVDAVDQVATAAVRQGREAVSSSSRYDFGPGRSAYMRQFPAAVLDELSGLLEELPHSPRYRGKKVAFDAMRQHFRSAPVARGWLGQNWTTIENTLFGVTRAAGAAPTILQPC